MLRGKCIFVKDSSERRLLMSQYSASSETKRAFDNAYGLLMFAYENGDTLPIHCTHGGSMWLCWPCANSIFDNQNQETGIERHWREQEELDRLKQR